jgi:DNA transformation protein
VEDDFLHDVFSAFGRISIRRMFGGKGIYRDGSMFALVAYGRIWLKADAQTEDLFRRAGSSPFVYDGRGRPITMSYWSLPDEALDDGEVLAKWALVAHEASLRTKRSTATKRRRHQESFPA